MATVVSLLILNLIAKSHNEAGTYIVVLLAWLMKIDGDEAQEERALLDDIMDSNPLTSSEVLFAGAELDSVEIECDILLRGLQGEDKIHLLQLYIGMLLADGYISSPEVFAIGFIADLFSVPPDVLNGLFMEIAGRRLPPPSDPSAQSWWVSKEQRKRKSSSHKPSSEGIRRIKALATLGLEENASLEEIKKSYRRCIILIGFNLCDQKR